jgi:hypothetical protein
VTRAKLHSGAVSASKVKLHSLLCADFKSGQLPAGATGPQGPIGPQGATGPQGVAGNTGPAGSPAAGIMMGSVTATSGNFAYPMGVTGTGSADGTADATGVALPTPNASSTASGLFVETDVAPGAGKSATYTISNTTGLVYLTCTMVNTTTSCASGPSATIPANTNIRFTWTGTGSPTFGHVRFAWRATS